MSSPLTSNITIVNRTAFPLNIALSIVAPFEHINSLEPGEVWTTSSPSFLPTSPNNFARQAAKALSPLLLAHSKWLKRLPIKPKVSIDIRFDHEHNRYTETEAFHSWTSFSTRWLGLLSLAGAFTMLLASQVRGGGVISSHIPPSSRSIPLNCLGLGAIGVVCLIASFYEHRLTHLGKDPTLTEGRIISAAVPAHTLYHSTSSPATLVVPSQPISPRANRNFAVLWIRGRFALWDLDLDQEVLALFNGRR